MDRINIRQQLENHVLRREYGCARCKGQRACQASSRSDLGCCSPYGVCTSWHRLVEPAVPRAPSDPPLQRHRGGAGGPRTNRHRLLIHSDRASIFIDAIEALSSDVEISVCDTYAGLGDALCASGAEIVLSHKFENSSYPGQEVVGAETVRWIHCGGTGVDHFAPWDAAKVTITNSPGVASTVMSEYVLGAIYALNLYLPRYMRRQQRHEWRRGTVRQTQGGTVAVIGLGRIGRAICARAKAAGLRVIGVRSRPGHVSETDETLTVHRLPDALRNADYVVVIVPLSSATKGLIGTNAIATIKHGAFIVNLSRGGIVDDEALIEALRSGQIGGAALDVFEREPLPAESPFWDFENVIVTPHSAGFVEGWESAVAGLFADNLRRWLAGRPLENVVAPEHLDDPVGKQ